MGFLDHSTNNIVVDAVLTNKGRKLLASGLGNFSIAKFAFSDDEVDYGIIKKFGRTVGKEKIEKNTPVFEALTSGNLGLRHKNVSINNNSLIRLPVLEVSSGLDAGGSVSLTRSSTDVSTARTKTVHVEQKIVGGVRLDHDVINYSYEVVVDHLFLNIRGKSVGEELEVKLLCPDDNETYVPVTIPIDEIGILRSDNHTNKIQVDASLVMEMKYPSLAEFIKNNFDFNNDSTMDQSFDLIASCVDKIYNEEEVWTAADCTKKEINSFLEQMNSSQFKEIETFFETMPKLSHTVKVKNPKTKVESTIVLEGLSSFFG